MRLKTFLLLACLCGGAHAAVDPAPVPPPPVFDPNESVDEPQVTITKQAEQTIEEYRVGGRLFMIKVTPKHGTPYYLVDDVGDGKFSRHDNLDSGIRPPRWILHRF